MQKLQQQLSDTSGVERGGGLAVALANSEGEWTNINADLVDGKVNGRDIILGLTGVTMSLRCAFPSKSKRLVCGRTIAVASSALAATWTARAQRYMEWRLK